MVKPTKKPFRGFVFVKDKEKNINQDCVEKVDRSSNFIEHLVVFKTDEIKDKSINNC
jgi:hypothetical protein